jgi:hypothetical protein
MGWMHVCATHTLKHAHKPFPVKEDQDKNAKMTGSPSNIILDILTTGLVFAYRKEQIQNEKQCIMNSTVHTPSNQQTCLPCNPGFITMFMLLLLLSQTLTQESCNDLHKLLIQEKKPI